MNVLYSGAAAYQDHCRYIPQVFVFSVSACLRFDSVQIGLYKSFSVIEWAGVVNVSGKCLCGPTNQKILCLCLHIRLEFDCILLNLSRID